MTTARTSPAEGNFFEDFVLGGKFIHSTPRTISEGDASLYIALTGARQPVFCSRPLAVAMGYRAMPLDDGLLFNMAFGKTVSDISANAVANLGYADVRFLEPAFAGDTISARSEVIGLRATSSGDSGVVYVRSTAFNQHGRPVLTWIRWVLVRARNGMKQAGDAIVPDLPKIVAPENLHVPDLSIDRAALTAATGSAKWWDDYAEGERIDHPAGMTLDESDHTLATKLYQNGAKVHFDAHLMKDTPHGRRLVYGGHVISVCRALSYDGLENVISIAAINSGSHCAPTFAGDTLYCFSEVVEKMEIAGRRDCGALRLRLVGLKNLPPAEISAEQIKDGRGKTHPSVVLDLDYTVILPRA